MDDRIINTLLDMKATLESHSKALVELQNGQNRLEGKIYAMEDDMTDIKTDIGDMKGDIADIKLTVICLIDRSVGHVSRGEKIKGAKVEWDGAVAAWREKGFDVKTVKAHFSVLSVPSVAKESFPFIWVG